MATRLQPAHEGGGLLGEADSQQAVDRKGGVPNPGVTIVPIAPAVGRFGNGSCGSRNDRAGFLEAAKLQGDRRPDDWVLPLERQRQAARPTAPVGIRMLRQVAR